MAEPKIDFGKHERTDANGTVTYTAKDNSFVDNLDQVGLTAEDVKKVYRYQQDYKKQAATSAVALAKRAFKDDDVNVVEVKESFGVANNDKIRTIIYREKHYPDMKNPGKKISKPAIRQVMDINGLKSKPHLRKLVISLQDSLA